MMKRNMKIFLHNAFIALLCVIWIIPIVWLVCTSFSAYSGMNTSTFFPEQWSAIHYVKLLTPDTVNQFPTWFWNTFVIACWTCVISTLFVIMVAYAMSVTRFKSRKALMNAAVLMNLFPGMLSMIAVYFTLKTFGLTNSHIGLILVYSASSGLGYLIADHNNQAFRVLDSVSLGDKAFILRGHSILSLACDLKMDGHNHGKGIVDAEGNFVSALSDYVCYTCQDNWNNVSVVGFRVIDEDYVI